MSIATRAATALALALAICGVASVPAYASPVVAGATQCSALKGLSDEHLKIVTAQVVPRGPQQSSGNAALTGSADSGASIFPAHCLVQGKIDAYLGADGKPYATNFEMRLPLSWDHRLLFQGGGGLDGSVAPALGQIVVNGSAARSALERGFAVVSMDGGHEGQGADFAADQQARLNFAFGAVGQVTTTAKLIIAKFYLRAPDKSYFMGCSNGGREAMIAAQRYPTQFDGIVAGDPAFNLSDASMLSHHGLATFAKVSPIGPNGIPVTTKAFSPQELKLVSDAVLKACDGMDGVKDGLIFNQEQCHFDPSVLKCRSSASDQCLSQQKVDVLKEAFAGPRDNAGNSIVGSWPYDAGVIGEGYREWRLGGVDAQGNAQTPMADMSDAVLTRYFNYPPIASQKFKPMDYSKMRADVAPMANLNNPTGLDFRTFEAKGGKLLMFTGWSDPVFTPIDLTHWYERLQAADQVSEGKATQTYARLFMVPGMNHCGGGPALDNFDPLTTVVNWVEHGKAPDSIIATGSSFPGQTRPLCAYPKAAQYSGVGSTNDATSYVCK
ncbi:tannase/feruloyl esterase family alpha/beta hydrolase [Pseudomonas sp. KK18]|uniref:tannase/feruloyl esterase family alpha/beta hydrolase n=1 Tax=Pseudomonas sp. KK18 TaxID=3123039 RepID=UPI0030D0F100